MHDFFRVNSCNPRAGENWFSAQRAITLSVVPDFCELFVCSETIRLVSWQHGQNLFRDLQTCDEGTLFLHNYFLWLSNNKNTSVVDLPPIEPYCILSNFINCITRFSPIFRTLEMYCRISILTDCLFLCKTYMFSFRSNRREKNQNLSFPSGIQKSKQKYDFRYFSPCTVLALLVMGFLFLSVQVPPTE